MRHALAVMFLFVVGSVQAATVVYSSPGIVTGIGGLDIGGTLYNVDFEAFGDAYSTFGGVEDYWATFEAASTAVTAINGVLNAEGLPIVVVNNFAGVVTEGDLYQVYYAGLAHDGIGFLGPWAPGIQNAAQDPFAATAWSVVPIPAAVWLFGSGLGLLGWLRRRQTA